MDSIANMFTQLKNAGKVGKKETWVSYSKLNLAILTVLKNKGIVADFNEEKQENQKYPKIKIKLAFENNNELPFNDIYRVSRPGRRIYIGSKKISQHLRGKSEILLSTSQGVMAGTEAKRKGLGGEIIGEVV